MARKSPTAQPIKKFFGKYANEIFAAEARQRQGTITLRDLSPKLGEEDFAPPRLIDPSRTWEELAEWWPFRLLRKAAAEKDAEGYKRLLHYFLLQLGVSPPKGVLVAFRWKVGRPGEAELIYAAWVSKGRPALNWRTLDGLAKVFYPDQFAKCLSDGKLRKNLRDRVGNAIRRHESQVAATKPHSIS